MEGSLEASEAVVDKPRKKAQPVPGPEEPNTLSIYETMRRVWAGEPVANNAATRTLRRQLKKEPGKFLQQLKQLEKAHTPVEGGKERGGGTMSDVGLERAGEVVGRLLGEFRG